MTLASALSDDANDVEITYFEIVHHEIIVSSDTSDARRLRRWVPISQLSRPTDDSLSQPKGSTTAAVEIDADIAVAAGKREAEATYVASSTEGNNKSSGFLSSLRSNKR